jgi:predicted RNA-binding Zn-ribbon protein involved in translation (DUF1610 family)
MLKEFIYAFSMYIDFHLKLGLDTEWLKEERPMFLETISLLKDAFKSDDIQSKVLALNVAKNITHSFDNLMIGLTKGDVEDINENDLIGTEGTNSFYNSLSQGDFISKWEQEVGVRAKNMNWYKIAQQKTVLEEGPGKISPKDLAYLYYYEKEYSELFIQQQSGQHLTESEYKKFHFIKPRLEKLAHNLGNQFYEIAELIQIVSDSYNGYFICPKCQNVMDVKSENSAEDIVECSECGFTTTEYEWQDFWGVEHTDYGRGVLNEFQYMWDEADTMEQEIVALHYIINAVHGSGRLIHLFMDRSGGGWIDKMKEFLDALSAGDIPKVRWQGRGNPAWDFQLDYGEFDPDFMEFV